jgi:hypothetical protein
VFWKWLRNAPVDAVERFLWPANLVIFGFGAIQFWRAGRRGRAKRIGELMLKHRRCPHCGYDVHGLTADPADGATICPECGCAWMLSAEDS